MAVSLALIMTMSRWAEVFSIFVGMVDGGSSISVVGGESLELRISYPWMFYQVRKWRWSENHWNVVIKILTSVCWSWCNYKPLLPWPSMYKHYSCIPPAANFKKNGHQTLNLTVHYRHLHLHLSFLLSKDPLKILAVNWYVTGSVVVLWAFSKMHSM